MFFLPHSGQVAAHAFSLLKNQTFKEVFILAPNHTKFLDQVSVDLRDFATPLGTVKNSSKSAKLAEVPLFTSDSSPHDAEHAIEVQLPFLQTVLKGFEIVPLVVGDVDPELIAEVLKDYLNIDSLLVISTDLSHYLSYDSAVSKDKKTIELIKNFDYEDLQYACGRNPLMVLLKLAKDFGWKIKILDYKNSGDTGGDKNRVVGYVGAVLYDE